MQPPIPRSAPHRRARRPLAATLALVLLVSVLALVGGTAAPGVAGAQEDGPEVTGTACRPGVGVTVVVDYQQLGGGVEIGCAPGEQTDGFTALTGAGFAVNEDPGAYPGTICQIRRQPAAGYPECWFDGFWGYWKSDGTAPWGWSQVGAGNGPLAVDRVEGWSWTSPIPSDYSGAPMRLSVADLAQHLPEPPDCEVIPQLPTFDIVASSEVLPVGQADGHPVEVAVLTDPAATPSDDDYEVASEVALAGHEGSTIRILARVADATCTEGPTFAATYDVRPTYAPRWNLTDAPGAPSPAVPVASPAIVGWASGHANYVAGANVTPNFQNPDGALGPASSGLVVLGDRGRIDLTFDRPITDGPGHDLAVFENGFAVGAAANEIDFLEVGYVEVSSNGTDFVRFDTASRQGTPVGGFQGQRADLLGGMAGKDLSGRGTPFDLHLLANKPEVRSGLVDLDSITQVRIVDITGDGDDHDSFGRPIYDAHPTTGSAGFDLTGVAALNALDVPPELEITNVPSGATTATSAEITFTVAPASGPTVTCRLDVGPWEPCTSPFVAEDLAEGPHSFEVRAAFPSGTPTVADAAWYVVAAPPPPPPAVTLTSVPSPLTADPSTTIAFTVEPGDDATVECRLDDGDWAPCSSPVALDDLDDGAHTFAVQAARPGGEAATRSTTWTVDTVAPTVSITAAPSGTVPTATAEVAFTVDDGTATVHHRLDDGDWLPVATPIRLQGLGDGPHTVTVRAVDPAGNEGTASATWTVAVPRRSAEEAWTWAAYQDFLDRAPSGFEVWMTVSRIDAGTPRATIAAELSRSEAWVAAVVVGFYQDTLGRGPDAAGLAHWVEQIRTGRRSVAQVAALFHASDEYHQRAGGTDAAWVAELYRAVLGREPDPAGLEFWVGRTATHGRNDVAGAVYDSVESRQDRVDALYRALLGRPADAAGLPYWAGRIRTEGDLALAMHLATSGEYLQRARARFP